MDAAVGRAALKGGGRGGLRPKFVYQNSPTRFSQRYIVFFPTMIILVWGGRVTLLLAHKKN